MGNNVRNLNWEEIDPNALHGAGEVVTKVRFWQRSWFLGFLFGACIALTAGIFFVHVKQLQNASAINYLNAFTKDVGTLEGLDKDLQLELILRERVGIQDRESVVRQADPKIAFSVGTAWTAVRRSALIPTVDSSQIRDVKKEAERGLTQLSRQKRQLESSFSGLICGTAALMFVTMIVAIRAIKRRATTLVVQSLGVGAAGSRGTFSDISASSVRESEAITRAVNNLPAAIFEFESDGKILRWNLQMQILTGIPTEKAIGRNVIDCVQWESTAEAAKSTIRKIFGGEKVPDLEWTMEHSMGEKIELHATIKPVVDGGGAVRSAAVVVRDITSEKYGRELLVSNDVSRLAIIKAVPNTLLRFDSALNLVEIHDNSQILGNDFLSLRGSKWRDAFGAELLNTFSKAAKQARLSQRPYSFEYEGELNGKRVALGLRIAVAGPSDLLAVVSDLSERQRLLEAESRSEARFKSLIEGSADTIMMLSEEGIILYSSPAVKAIMGLESSSFTGRNWLELVHKDDREAGEQSWANMLNSGKEATQFCLDVVGDGSVKTAEFTARNMLADRSVEAVIFNIRDITERRQLEKELQSRVAELKVQNEALQDANMRDPLTGSLNYQALLHYLEAICGYVEEEGMFSAVLIDIDDFKRYNAEFGFSSGDALLRQLTGVVKDACREDDVFGRSGAEEFLLILPEVDEEMAEAVCERVRSRFDSVTDGWAKLSFSTVTKRNATVSALDVLDELSKGFVLAPTDPELDHSSAA